MTVDIANLRRELAEMNGTCDACEGASVMCDVCDGRGSNRERCMVACLAALPELLDVYETAAELGDAHARLAAIRDRVLQSDASLQDLKREVKRLLAIVGVKSAPPKATP